MTRIATPRALFDDIHHIDTNLMPSSNDSKINLDDFNKALEFLKSYKGSQGTFNAYRREVERLLHWTSLVANKTLKDLKRNDIENFIQFSINPPPTWIGIKKATRFIEDQGLRLPNPEWRPFVVIVSKSAFRKGVKPEIKNYELSQNALKEVFAILSSFFNYLLQDEYVMTNPVALIRQKSKFIRKQQGHEKIRRLTNLQWEYVIHTAEKMANENPELHERTLFMMSALYSMYLRISEIAANERWVPQMNHFHRDHESNWWFTTVGKGNKERLIAVSDTLLNALKRWRNFLGLSSLPSPADQHPIFPKSRGKGPITSTTHIREIVQQCFDDAVEQLKIDGHHEDAESLVEATVHWLRHTGISEDVKHRPREHVRDDAGHSSSAITDRYIDIELRERHRSAKKKTLLK